MIPSLAASTVGQNGIEVSSMSNYQQRLVRLCALLLSLSAASPSCVAEQAEAGERLFLDNCAECHQPNGKGIRGVYPSLAASEIVRGSGADVALQLIIGRGEMPSFAGALSAAEMATLINFVRNAWGNSGEPISEEAVAGLMP